MTPILSPFRRALIVRLLSLRSSGSSVVAVHPLIPANAPPHGSVPTPNTRNRGNDVVRGTLRQSRGADAVLCPSRGLATLRSHQRASHGRWCRPTRPAPRAHVVPLATQKRRRRGLLGRGRTGRTEPVSSPHPVLLPLGAGSSPGWRMARSDWLQVARNIRTLRVVPVGRPRVRREARLRSSSRSGPTTTCVSSWHPGNTSLVPRRHRCARMAPRPTPGARSPGPAVVWIGGASVSIWRRVAGTRPGSPRSFQVTPMRCDPTHAGRRPGRHRPAGDGRDLERVHPVSARPDSLQPSTGRGTRVANRCPMA